MHILIGPNEVNLSDVKTWVSTANITDGTYTIALHMGNGTVEQFMTKKAIEWQEMIGFEQEFINFRTKQINDSNLGF